MKENPFLFPYFFFPVLFLNYSFWQTRISSLSIHSAESLPRLRSKWFRRWHCFVWRLPGGPGVASCWQRGGARGLAGHPAPGAAVLVFPLAERRESCVTAGPFRPCGVTESRLPSVPLLPSQSPGWLLAAPDAWRGGVVGGAGAAAR